MDATVRNFLTRRGFENMDKADIEDALHGISPEWQIQIWNDFCEQNHYSETIFNNDKDNISDLILDTSSLIEMIKGRYDYSDAHFYITDDNELISFNEPGDEDDRSPIYFEDLAGWIEDELS